MITTLKMIKVVYWLVFCIVYVSAVEYNRNIEGYFGGFMSDCPEAQIPVTLTPGDLEKITISAIGTSDKWKAYNFRKLKKLAKHPGVDLNNKIFMYITGYMDMTMFSMPLGKTMAKAYRNMGYTVMILNTLDFTFRDFPTAARYVPEIGKHVAGILANLTNYGLDPKKLELVGLSTGAQAMSFVAKNYREITGKNISSLTALDPAGPCFRHLGPDRRLDPSDADFVLSIATNIDGFGMATPLGHVTFYVNGGEYQPGDVLVLPCTIECSHVRSYFLWLSALVNPNTFVGTQCGTIQQAKDLNCYDRTPRVTNTMDLLVDKSKPGIYFMPTSHKYPYALGKAGLKKKYNAVLNQLDEYNAPDVASA